MKPSDRSLDIAVLGLGQGGGNIAAEFARRGYRALALNTARTDLNALGPDGLASLPEAQRLYIGVDGYDGAGSDLTYGRQCISESAERIRDAVARWTEEADVVMLVAGLGGGTGSAIAELVRVLEPLELPLTTLCTLPSDHESSIAKVNAVRAISELASLPNLGLAFVDNARLAQAYGDVAMAEYFARINQAIIDPLDAFNRLNKRPELQSIRSLDGEDLRTLLLSTGVLTFSQGEVESLSVEVVTDWVSRSLAAGEVMPAGFNMQDIAYLGLVVEAGSALLASTPFSFFNEVGERLKQRTGGAGIYTGIYRSSALDGRRGATLRLLASTASLPEGIARIVGDAQREGNTLREKLQRQVVSIDLSTLDGLDLLPSRSGPPATAPRRRARAHQRSRGPGEMLAASMKTIAGMTTGPVGASVGTAAMGNPFVPPPPPAPSAQAVAAPSPSLVAGAAPVGVPPAAPSAASAPSPAPSSPSPPTMPTSTGPSHASPPPLDPRRVPPESVVAPRPRPEPPPLEAGPGSAPRSSPPPRPSERAGRGEPELAAEPETYDRLVDTFLSTDSEATRRTIAYRLHVSRNSDHPLARFYANRAIERLIEAGAQADLDQALGQLSAE